MNWKQKAAKESACESLVHDAKERVGGKNNCTREGTTVSPILRLPLGNNKLYWLSPASNTNLISARLKSQEFYIFIAILKRMDRTLKE